MFNSQTPTNEPAKNARETAILSTYLNAPSGQAAAEIERSLASLKPRPTIAEAIRLTRDLPAITQSQVLARFSRLSRTKGGVHDGRGRIDQGGSPRKPKVKRGRTADQSKAIPKPEISPPGVGQDPRSWGMREFSGTAWRVFPTNGRDGFSILFPCGYRTKYGFFDLLGEAIPEEIALLVLDSVARRIRGSEPIKLHQAVSTRTAFSCVGAEAWGNRGDTWWKKLASEESVVRGSSASMEEYERAMRKLNGSHHVG